MTPPTPLEELRRLAEAATPGPWTRRFAPGDSGEICTVGNAGMVSRRGVWRDTPERAVADAEFIAACDPDTIKALLDELEGLREAVDAGEEYIGFVVSGDESSPEAGMAYQRWYDSRAALAPSVSPAEPDDDVGNEAWEPIDGAPAEVES